MASVSASGELVERERELAVLRDVMTGAADGRGALVVAEGHGGIGKTRLLEEAAAVAGSAGLEVLQASGHDLEGEFAYGVALQLLQRRIVRAPAAERDAVLEGAASLARPLLEGVEPLPAAEALQHGLFWIVSNLADRRPALIVVDDAHLADTPSLRFLLYLAQRVEELPVAVALAVRPGEAGEREALIGRLRSHPATTPLALAPLTAEGVGWLAADHGFAGADAAFVRACAEATGGNPFLVKELLSVLRAQGIEGRAADAARVGEIGPTAVAHAVWLALERLPAEATALARAAAVLGDGAALRHAARLAAVDADAAAAGATALADAGILRPAADLSFVHAIVRAAVYDDLSAHERSHAHAVAARILDGDAHVGAGDVAAHLLSTGAVGEPWAAEAIRTAAAAAETSRDPGTARRLLLRLLDEPLDDAGRAATLLALARAESALTEGEPAGRLEAALGLLGDADQRVAVLLQLGRTLHQAGRFSDAAATFQRGLDEQPADPELLADLRSGWANAALWDPQQGSEALGEAMATVTSIVDPATVAERTALANVAGALTLRGEQRELAVDLALRAWGGGALLREAGPEEPGYFALAPTLGWADDLDTTREVYASVADAAWRQGLVIPFATAMYGVGGTLFFRGALAEAIAALQSAFDAERYGWGQFVTGAMWMLSRALIESGEVAEAERVLALDAERERELAATPDFTAVQGARAYLHLAKGDPERAGAEAKAAGRTAALIGVANPAFFPWRPALISSHLALGRIREATATADEQLEAARRWGAPSVVGGALADRARAEEDPEARAAGLDEAVATLARSPNRLTHAHALVDLGAARRAFDAEGARGALREGLDMADRCGASPLVARARHELVAAGGRPRRSRTTGAAALTPAELRVARMAVDGLTNREIAERLFVTVKAVKFHLGNAYRKLGIGAREELAAALGRDGEQSPDAV